jgi:DNA-binding IclR family transcriptional regulator
LGKAEDQVVEVLRKAAGKPLTLIEIAEQVNRPPKRVFSSMRKLFEAGKVDVDHKTRTYTLTE